MKHKIKIRNVVLMAVASIATIATFNAVACVIPGSTSNNISTWTTTSNCNADCTGSFSREAHDVDAPCGSAAAGSMGSKRTQVTRTYYTETHPCMTGGSPCRLGAVQSGSYNSGTREQCEGDGKTCPPTPSPTPPGNA